MLHAQTDQGSVMPRDGTITRNKIMDVAQNMVLDVGLSGTSVEKVIDEAGVTKKYLFLPFQNQARPGRVTD